MCVRFTLWLKRARQKNFKNLTFRVFLNLCFYFDSLQKGVHLYQRGPIQRGPTNVLGGRYPKLHPPGSVTAGRNIRCREEHLFLYSGLYTIRTEKTLICRLSVDGQCHHLNVFPSEEHVCMNSQMFVTHKAPSIWDTPVFSCFVLSCPILHQFTVQIVRL